jgi:hypothetical protein
MPEEEETFTFVDKRRTRQDAAPEQGDDTEAQAAKAEEPASPLSSEVSDEDAGDAEFAGEGPPDTYSLIGYCVSLLSADAWQKLGLMADPQTGQAVSDLTQAKVAIDAVGSLAGYLEAAPREAVPDNLRRELRTLLNDLRLNYVSQQNQSL